MNCERCQNELEDFLYGELGEARAADVRAHLGNCADCAALRDNIEHENELFAKFYEQSAIEPAGETWDAIRARIADEPNREPQIEPEIGWGERLRRGVFGWLLTPANLRQMAFALLLIAFSVAATAIYLRRGQKETRDIARQDNSEKSNQNSNVGPSASPTPASSPSTNIANNSGSKPGATQPPNPVRNHAPQFAAPQQPAPQLSDQELMNRQIARAGREYQKAIKMLDQAIAKRRDGLDPALVKQYESSLALIDKSIDESRQALRARPDDPTAGQFLLAAYAKKLELMQDIAMQ